MPEFTNTSEVNSTDSAILCGTTTDTDTETTTILAESESLTVTKTVSDTEICADGSHITYTITVRNTSAAPKTITLVDTITVPGGTILPGDVASTNPVATSITPVVNGIQVQWTDTIIPGKTPPDAYHDQIFTITLATTCGMVGTLSDVANILFSGSDIPSNTVTTLVKAVVDLTIDKTKASPADPVYVGDTVEYDIIVTNNGPCAATGVYVDDTLPVTANIVPDPSWVLQSGTTYRYTIGNLAAGATIHIPLKVVPTSPSVP